MVYEPVQAWLVFRVDCTGVVGFDKPALTVLSKKSAHCIYMYLGTQTSASDYVLVQSHILSCYCNRIVELTGAVC